ncbi:MAG TPA: response regulator [Coleofasciculaceae cyanobacterium]
MDTSFNRSKIDILIVDDTLDNLQLLSMMLTKEGYNVRKAISGSMALKAAQTVTPEIILLDVNMPEMNGYEVCEQLKHDPKTAAVPIIFLSALDDALDKVRAFQVGGSDYITKPFQLEEVLVRIQNQLTIRQLQAQLEVRNAELQQTLQDLKSAQVQLVQKEKMTGLGQLVSGIAHEINNPVNFIAGNISPARQYVEDLLNILALYQQKYPDADPEIEAVIEAIDLSFLSTDIQRLMDSMQTGAKRIQAIVLALRTFSHLDEAKVKAVDLHAGLDSVLLLLQRRLRRQRERAEIKVIREWGNLSPINCYASELNQVFLSLLNNAIDAIEGQMRSVPPSIQIANPCIWIRTEQKLDKVLISIRDNGPGIDQEIRSRIYEPFFTTKAVGKGFGLGLSVSYHIVVEKHGGQLTCDSVPGQGTEFMVELPLYPIHVEELEVNLLN